MRSMKKGGDEMNIYSLLALFAGIMIGANFTVIILAFMGAGKDVDSDK